jgi:predicted alternative tryptophan synthase beta-subunit
VAHSARCQATTAAAERKADVLKQQWDEVRQQVQRMIEQEVSQQRWIDIPDEVFSIYKLWRPTPLCRAKRLEEALKTPARIYYKNESVSPAGSHKPNTAVAQPTTTREKA